ncbi:Chemotaxis response regulator protein-glutamate methylesterase [Posidoniimonas polymericola]|uniref:Protein-glutamate methylesterase/protein-glutamine glutaminase n=1 Tax=Posidoniimonas polymericola TaxID=2528002 RepID=A0A5C5YBL4_9BACT|nr:chemotaxis response regulator protein-glutamate methylesterase [Posidoniimonas polymericola]TWT72780.1 Chemotaxis response regulator protein-glutamate methylesterase [Posidoniimonas polymericola]
MKTNSTPLKVLVVDDSALYRKIVRDVLSGLEGVEVVGAANNGVIALERIKQLKPDVVTLDVEMPQLDGHGVLKQLANVPNAPKAIMVSAFTAQGAQSTNAALREGAFDFILKPATKSLEMSVQQLRRDLIPKIEACRGAAAPTGTRAVSRPALRPARPAAPVGRISPPRRFDVPPRIVAIGVSTGGPQALVRLLPRLPANFPCPILLVQHMPPMFTASLAEDLNRRCSLTVSEGRDGQPVRRGEVIIAPGGKHMRVVRQDKDHVIQITDDAPERNCKPSVDYLFRSVAEVYGAASLGVVLTGMGDDGALGAAELKKKGGQVLSQDESSCVVYGMPKAVFDAGLSDEVASLDMMPTVIGAYARGGARV